MRAQIARGPSVQSYTNAARGCVLLAGLAAAAMSGCSHGPTVGITDPAVYTQAHIRAAQEAYALDADADNGFTRQRGSKLSVFTDLQRYFLTTDAEYAKRGLRIDKMLDGQQQRRSTISAVLTSLKARIATTAGTALPAADGGAKADSSKPSDAPLVPDETTTAILRLAEGALEDSPFDRLERANDLYGAFTIKMLQLYGKDSRAMSPEKLRLLASASGAPGASGSAQPTMASGPSAYPGLGTGVLFTHQLPKHQTAPGTPSQTNPKGATTEAQNPAGAISPTEELAEKRELAELALQLDALGVGSDLSQQTLLQWSEFRSAHLPAVAAALLETWARKNYPKSLAAISEAVRQTLWALDDRAALSAVREAKAEAEKAVKAAGQESEAAKKDVELRTERRDKAKADLDTKAAAVTQLTADLKLAKDNKLPDDQVAKIAASLLSAQGELRTATETSTNLNKELTTATKTLDEKKEAVEKAKGALATAVANEASLANAAAVREAQRAAAAVDTPQETKRLILLILQVNIEPGNQRDMMAGYRLKLVDWTGDGTASTPSKGSEAKKELKDIQILHVQPAHVYDLAENDFLDQIQSLLNVAVAGKVGSSVDLATDLKQARDLRDRRRFLSRINKNAAFTDAASHTIGWNFYPSNLQTERTGWFNESAQVSSYLEAGARDCAVWLLVPREARTLRFDASMVSSTIVPTLFTGSELAKQECGQVTVSLPAWDRIELDAVHAINARFSPPEMPTKK